MPARRTAADPSRLRGRAGRPPAGPALPPGQRAGGGRLCRRAELGFGLALPDGAAVVRRALDSLAMTEQEGAPVIDWGGAARRAAAGGGGARAPRARPGREAGRVIAGRGAARRVAEADAAARRTT